MKAVVVEVKKSYVAVLQEDGCITKLKNSHLQIGDIVHMKTTPQKHFSYKQLVSAAAIFILVVSAGIFTYAMPVYYVSVDVNPSILMKANIFERVLGVEAVNDDALPILEDLDLKNTSVEKAVTKVMERLNNKGYFKTAGTDLVIATSAKDDKKADILAQKIEEAADEEIAQEGTDVAVDSRGAGYDMVQKAKELGITPGKLNIITHVLGFDDPEEYKEYVAGVLDGTLSTKDLMQVVKLTKGNKKVDSDSEVDTEDKATSDEDSNEDANGNGKEKSNGNSKGKALGITKEKTTDDDAEDADKDDDKDADSDVDADEDLEEDSDDEDSDDKDSDDDDNDKDSDDKDSDDEDKDDEDKDDEDKDNEDSDSDDDDNDDSDDETDNDKDNAALKEARKELLNKLKGSKNK